MRACVCMAAVELRDVVLGSRDRARTSAEHFGSRPPINLRLASGSFTVLLGRTGSGKTSLLRLLAGLDRPASGSVLVDGRPVAARAPADRGIALVVQAFINYPSLTVYENIAAPLRNAGLSDEEVDSRATSTALLLGLREQLQKLPSELSGGQQQRTALARALAKDAGLVLLDEPLVNLDFKLRESLREELREILRARGATVVFASTEPDEALLFQGDVLILDAGSVAEHGPALESVVAPSNVRAARLSSDPPMNILQAEVAEGQCRAGAATVTLPDYAAQLALGPLLLGFRPTSARLVAQADPTDSLVLEGRIELSELTGSETFLHLRVSDTEIIVREPGLHRRRVGQLARVAVPREALYFFDTDGRRLAGGMAGAEA